MLEKQETQVQFLGQEDPLEKEMTIHLSILAWKIPWTEEPGGLYSPRCCIESETHLLICIRESGSFYFFKNIEV